ncbi:MAG: hypothetical protein ACOX2W_02490 [Desulfomonilia bacterium]
MSMIGIFFLSLSVVLGSAVVAQATKVAGTYAIEQGASLPPAAV